MPTLRMVARVSTEATSICHIHTQTTCPWTRPTLTQCLPGRAAEDTSSNCRTIHISTCLPCSSQILETWHAFPARWSLSRSWGPVAYWGWLRQSRDSGSYPVFLPRTHLTVSPGCNTPAITSRVMQVVPTLPPNRRQIRKQAPMSDVIIGMTEFPLSH